MASPRLTEPLLTRLERNGTRSGPFAGDLDREAVRDQLDRILASPVFRNSKRNSSLLKHVVERVLDGRPEDLKERNIGVDVFGRAADYDTNSDHVVRSVAGEVRRRLAQYYMDLGRDAEARIELQPGSYVPQFRPKTDAPPPPVAPTARSVPWRSAALIAGVVLLATLAAALGLPDPARALHRFWGPFLASRDTALLCVGGGGQPGAIPDPGQALSVGEFDRQPSRRMHTSDALALAGLAAMLQSNGKPYRVGNRAGAPPCRGIQTGPFVLIGGMNNEWTLRLTRDLRFGFERQQNGARVVDRQNPAKTGWSVDFTTSLTQFTRDYAIVSRVRDAQTEQTAVIVAGIG